MGSASEDINRYLLIGHYAEKPLSILKVVPEMHYYKPSALHLSDVVRRNPMWNMAHLIAHFDYVECFNNITIQSLVNIPCGDSLMTPLHVAIKSQHLESVHYLMDLDACLETVDVNGYNAFHFAANSSKNMIKVLAKKPVYGAVNAKNSKGWTPLYLACEAGKIDCVRELIKAGATVNLGHIYNDPLPQDVPPDHLPSLFMSAFLGTLSRQLSFSDTIRDETTLHWSKNLELMEILIENCDNINAKNQRGESALHIMVKLNRLPCTVMLLSHQADVNIQDSEGNTSLHLAVTTGDLSMVQTIISFGADVSILNNRRETARHLAATYKNVQNEILFALHVVKATRCYNGMNACREGCSYKGSFDGTPPKNCAISKKTETLFQEILESTNFRSSAQNSTSCKCSSSGSSSQESRVLCLDGGGIRGLVLIQMLDELERVLGKPITECFDLISGTSTGGILALALATGKTIKECRCLYFRLKNKVFVGVRPYDADLFEKFLQKELGLSKTMADIEKPKIMITATRKDRQPAELHIFRNYKSPVMLLNHIERDTLNSVPLPHPAEQLLWEVARATSSAPTYFRAHGPYIDGGLISNNPTLDTLTEIHQCNQAWQATGQSDKTCRIKVLISLGTGRVPLVPVHLVEDSHKQTDSPLMGFFSTVCHLTKEVANMGELVIDQVTQPDGRVTARALAICDMLHIPYLRLNPQLTENVALDETDPKTLAKMLWETTAYMRSMKKELEEIKHLLV